MRKFLFLFLMMLTVGSCVVGAPKAPVKKPLPVWKPAPALLKQLAPQAELPFGTVRLPRGYEFVDFPFSLEAGTALSWVKKSVKGEVDAMYFVMQIPAEELGWKNASLEEVLRGYMDGFYKGMGNARYTSVKQGVVNGVRTLRTNWSGVSRATDIKYQGSLFVQKDATDVYIIQVGQRTNSLAAQRLSEASALTFKIHPQD